MPGKEYEDICGEQSEPNRTNANTCKICGKETAEDNESAIKCDGHCCDMFHIKCVKMTASDVQAIRRPSTCLMWLCKQCRTGKEDGKGIEASLRQIINVMGKKIEQLEEGIRKIVAEEVARALKPEKETENKAEIETIKRKNESQDELNKFDVTYDRGTVIIHTEERQSIEKQNTKLKRSISKAQLLKKTEGSKNVEEKEIEKEGKKRSEKKVLARKCLTTGKCKKNQKLEKTTEGRGKKTSRKRVHGYMLMVGEMDQDTRTGDIKLQWQEEEEREIISSEW